ncbi:MAG: DUF2341 domain-containing protein, partial [Candidatus Kariarchaeaceae archaeon]
VNSGSQNRFFDGKIDEARLSSVARSENWISTEYNNQFDPSNFYSVSYEDVQSFWPQPDFQYRKKINIDNTNVSGTTDLEDFPILVELHDTDLHGQVQPDGDDIIFLDILGLQLDHEIELFNQSYNSTHAHLVAWVRVPSLSATRDTIITMYYGNSTVGSQENPIGVWNSNYMGVWHLSEHQDSFQVNTNNNDAEEVPDGTYYESGNNCDEGAGTATFGSCGASDASSYYRFETTGINNGASITSATLTLYAVLNGYNDDSGISTRFQGIDEDNTPEFSTGNKPSTRSRTTAYVDKSNWVSEFTSQYNPIVIDVTNIVQEIIDRVGFEEGNAIGITHRRNGGNAGAYGSIWEYTGSPTYAPKLEIDFGLPAYDSTSYGINGSLAGGVTQGVTGQTGNGYEFDGTNGFVNFGNPVDGHFDFGLESFSFSLWLKDSFTGGYQRPVWKGAHNTGTPGYSMYRRSDGQTVITVGDNIDREKESPLSFPYDTMTYVTGVVDRDNDLLIFYIDGTPVSPGLDISAIGSSTSSAYDLLLSRDVNPVKGIIDEFRVSNVSRSADWIATEYNNQFNPSNFYEIGKTEFGPNYQGPPIIAEVVTGEVEGSNSVTTNSPILGRGNHLYIAAISSKIYQGTTSVTGLDLTWIELEDQPAGRSQTGISVWYAIGSSPSTGTVTATISSVENVAIQVYRFAGVDNTDPIGDHESANTNGENGAGSGGVDNDYPNLDIVTTTANAIVMGLIARRMHPISVLGSGYSLVAENQAGSSGDSAGLSSEIKTVATIGNVVVDTTLEGDVDWAMAGIEIKGTQVINDTTQPVLNNMGVEDPGTGTGTFWTNVTDNIAVNNVTLKVNSSFYDLAYNGSLWTYPLEVTFQGYYTFQIFNASDTSGNFLSSASSIENHTFNIDNTVPNVIDWIY